MKRGRTDQELLELIENKKRELEDERERMFSHLKIPIPKVTENEADILVQNIEKAIVDMFSKQHSSLTISIFPNHDICFYNTPLYNWAENFSKLQTYEKLMFCKKWIPSEFSKFAREIIKIWNDNHDIFEMVYDNEYALIINKKK